MARTGETAGGAASAFAKEVEELLVTLRRSSRDLAFYPSSHPMLKRSMQNAVSQLRAVAAGRAPLVISVARTGLSVEELPVGQENRQLATMAGELFVRRIQRIQFAEDVGMEELAAFLRMITSDPKQLLQQGGPVKTLAASRVQRIQVIETEFRHLSETRDSTRETTETADKGGPETRSQEGGAAAGRPQSQSPKGQESSAAEATLSSLVSKSEETVEALIQRLEREAASDKSAGYEWAAARLETAAGQAVRTDRLQEVVASLGVFLRHRQAGNFGAPIRERATRAVGTIAAGSTVPYLVQHLRTGAGAPVEELVALLVGLGGRVIPALFELLAAGDQGVPRNRLVPLLSGLLEVAQPELSRALPGADRDQACRLASILGEIGGEAGATLLGTLLRHQDVRVRREAVRELGRIGGPSAHRLLLQALRDPEPAVVEPAIGLVGAARLKLAVPPLLRLAGQRVLSGRPFAVRKAAVTALGAVGDPGTIPALVRVLRTRTWFRRAAGDQLRLAAAQALLSMLQPEARDLVEAGARSRRRDVRRACNAALRKFAVPTTSGE